MRPTGCAAGAQLIDDAEFAMRRLGGVAAFPGASRGLPTGK